MKARAEAARGAVGRARGVAAKLIEQVLSRDGWPVERVAENAWRSAFRGETATFRFFVKLIGQLVVLEIAPYLPRPRTSAAVPSTNACSC